MGIPLVYLKQFIKFNALERNTATEWFNRLPVCHGHFIRITPIYYLLQTQSVKLRAFYY